MKHVFKTLEKEDEKIINIAAPKNSSSKNKIKLDVITLSQIERMFGVYLIDFNPRDIIVTADVDMLPLNAV